MLDTLGESLRKLKQIRSRRNRVSAVVLILSLLVSLDVFVALRQPGLTLAGDADCAVQEHTHDESCRTKVCICELPEEPHTHDETCFTVNWIEEQEELRLICEKTEEPHIHSEDCYETAAAQDPVLICENGEETHNHEETCYAAPETDGEPVLICDLISEPHIHTETCFAAEVTQAHEERTLTCTLSEQAHVHEDACYEWNTVCQLEEHVHSIACYSDSTADVETMLDWQDMFADYPYTGFLYEDLVGIAKTQVGYAESALNFEMGSDGVRRGYTRYGAWYGTPYRDWSAMFVSFCLNYAGADPEEFPGNTGAASMMRLWDKLGRYAAIGTYDPMSGDLVFFDDNTVGIVAEVYSAACYVIGGDVDDAVCGYVLSLTDPSILGWGITDPDDPVTDEPTESDDPVTDEPTESEDPAADEPTESDDPVTDEPTESDDPVTDEPTESDDPVTDEAIESEDPAADEEIESEEPVTDEATESEKPKDEEPTLPELPLYEEPSLPELPEPILPDAPSNEEPTLPELPPYEAPSLPDAPTYDEPTLPDAPTYDEPSLPDAPEAEEPAEQEEPKVETPVEQEKPKVETPVEQEKPKVEEPVEQEKPKVEEPAEQEKPATEAAPETEASDTHAKETDALLDISNGPAFFIFEGGEKPQQVQQRFTFRMTRTVRDLLAYLETNGGNYFFTLLDKNNHELPKDANGNYIAQADTGYKLTISFNSPEGFLPGTYLYEIPNGMLVDGGEGTFILKDGTNVGSWTVSDDGLITLVFNENINSRTDITISSTLGIHFPEQEEPIDFDGKITVTIEKPPEEVLSTEVQKWGSQGNTTDERPDKSKIYWTILISGNQDSHIPGSMLTDRVLQYDWSYPHRYTQSDFENGISFGASAADPEATGESSWHSWMVYPGDPSLTWDEGGWSYQMPETVTCELCGETITLGNEYWTYYVNYTSTPDASNIAGGLPYANRVEIDDQTAEGWAKFTQTEIRGDVFKTGRLVSDADGGEFVWELQVSIPGRKHGEKAYCDWFINDIMTIRDRYGTQIAYAPNDLDKATVTANYRGKTINVPRIQDATENDPYVWMIGWSSDQGGNGYYDLRQIYILCRCDCTEESCGIGNCWTYGYMTDDGKWVPGSAYCPCWTETEDTTFTFTYQTKDADIIASFGGLDFSLQNEVMLAYGGTPVADDYAKVQIPNMLTKELTHDFNGYTANYKVTVNEAKLVLTDGSPLTIHDVMTDTMAYISGSLVITAEDANGSITELRQGVDYTVAYDGTGNQVDEAGNEVHVLDIVILHPQPVMYTLDYDTTLIIPNKVTEGIKYSNSAVISLWGTSIKESTDDKVHADINIAAKSFTVDLFKTSAVTGEPLGGAVFGLYNEHGGLITSDKTDANGKLKFQTNVIEGIILREHVLYYMQEQVAPEGYQVDDTKFWFCFCDTEEEACATCDTVLAGKDGQRIPFEQIGKVTVSNQLADYDLPATGGPGIYPLILVSAIFIVVPLVYRFFPRRKQERRGVG